MINFLPSNKGKQVAIFIINKKLRENLLKYSINQRLLTQYRDTQIKIDYAAENISRIVYLLVNRPKPRYLYDLNSYTT